jgi:hypothetical protein
MSQAAASFSRPSGWAQRGMAGSPLRASTRAASAGGTMGLVKNEPHDRRFSSPASITIDLDLRMATTLSRTWASEGRAIPRAAR